MPSDTRVAIVGMACRFPGAADLNEYWRLLRAPSPQFTPVPASRWRHEAFLTEDPRDPHGAYADRIATLADIEQFDAGHYRVPPFRARAMDPQHRLLIDLTRAALQDAGLESRGFDRTDVSVIMGMAENGFRDITATNLRLRQLVGGEFGIAPSDPDWAAAGAAVERLRGTSVSGSLLSFGPGSISSIFDLHGESYALDAACSSVLTAVSNGVQALRSGRSRMVVAGGAQLLLTPDLYIGLSRIGGVSPTGTCRAFDERADGFVPAEAAGVVILKRLEDATADGDRVYAVIRGMGLGNDGWVPGGLTPQAAGQLLALRRAYSDAGVPDGDVGYLEAHGTATGIGDQVELAALRELRHGRAGQAWLGAVKAVVGHSLAAAGIAGLIKTTLMLRYGVIVPQPDFQPASRLDLASAGLTVPTELVAWDRPPSGPRRAGVSAFGFGGTNTHLVLEEAPARTRRSASRPPAVAGAAVPAASLLVLTGRDRAGLARHAGAVAAAIGADGLDPATVANTLAHRHLLGERLVVLAATSAEAVERLTAAAAALAAGHDGRLAAGVYSGSVPDTADGPDETLDLAALSLATGEEPLLKRIAETPGLRLLPADTELCTLPASPLRPQRHWLVNDSRRQAPRDVSAVDIAAAPDSGPDAAVGVPAVLERISRISALPPDDLHRHLHLSADLGLDSLMLTDLEAALRADLPGAAARIDLLTRDLTVAELLELTGAPGRPAAVPAPRTGDEPVPVDSRGVGQWPAGTASVEVLPEVHAMEQRLRQLEQLGLPNPYFRVHQGVMRNVTTVAGRELVSFSSYNYLGLSGHPRVNAAVAEAVDRYGTSVSGSRLLSGERPLTIELERALADLLRTEDCLTLVSGHATNVSAIGHLVGPGDLILHDALAHDSILQGCMLSGATRRPFAHNDVDELEHLLRRTRSRFRRVLVVVEGLYSMDGDLANLPALIDLKRRFGALLMVDEAHSIGTIGPRGGGVGEHFDVDRSGVDLWMGTLSKSFASCGGYLAGSARTIRWLRYTLPGFVYSVGLTPANAAAALAAVRIAAAEPERLAALRRNSALLLELARAAGVHTGPSHDSPIVPCIVGDSNRTLELATRLFERGIVVDPILHPGVAESETRLRFFVTSDHTEQQIRTTVAILAAELGSAVAALAH
ncbi:aminotransferase class I/II-fold pyridoxal phosphate-dependent enzyme [Krasilnikovia sp. M28-CT-15]|uniref:aminotransferase class I/II-fold pyridoxal phosphate-dependent enzyme n=1 Tax=Krasilnikovia sp. M28-CT-15 TaxID=3373540 RepID=UPI0038765CF6